MTPLMIPFKNFQGTGGPYTFMRNLNGYLKEAKLPVIESFEPGASIFFPISYDLKTLSQVKKHGGKVIQRLDGVYYPEKHGLTHLWKNHKIKKIYSKYSDFFVFQSAYSKAQCELMFGGTSRPHATIYNGVNTDIFFPTEGKRSPSDPFKIITTGVFRNEDMVLPVIDALDTLAQKYDFRFQLLGPVPNKKIQGQLKRPYIEYLGTTSDQKQIASYLRQADLFVYSHLNPPCPNSVVEAIGCGLPVVGFDSGSLLELCPHHPELFAKTPKKILHQLKDFDPRELSGVFERAFENLERYQESARANSGRLSLNKMGEEYVKVFKSVCS